MTRDLPFLKAIAAQPGVALPRLVFADYLDDHGRDNEAAGQRWAAARSLRPQPWEGWYTLRCDKDHSPHAIPRTLYTGIEFNDPLYRIVKNPLYYEAWFLRRCRERWHLVPAEEN